MARLGLWRGNPLALLDSLMRPVDSIQQEVPVTASARHSSPIRTGIGMVSARELAEPLLRFRP